jgi:hypothetical protein
MSSFKKLIPWILCLVLFLSLVAACDELADENDTSQDGNTVEVTATVDEATAVSDSAEESVDSKETVDEATPEEETTEEDTPESDSPTASTTQAEGEIPDKNSGKIVADLGFRPESNGFQFENYGNESKPTDLTSAEVERMFGEQACSYYRKGKCILTPPGKSWMEQTNDDMDGGHCEGMAALSLLMFTGQISPDTFGAELASELNFESKPLQREIAYWWSTQTVDPTYNDTLYGTPKEILDVLLTMTSGSEETYTIGIFMRDGSGGHAITPFAVQDQGNGIYAVLVYDNNYPLTTRHLMIDSNANTWSYQASINPSVEPELYEGDADTQSLTLTPTSARLETQDCPFCEDEGSAGKTGNGVAAPARQQANDFNQIYLDGQGDLLITDSQDRRLGYVDGKLVKEIPQSQAVVYKMDASGETPEPLYLVPQNQDLTIEINGNNLQAESPSDLVIIGPGYSLGVEGIALEPDQVDTVWLFPNDDMISYDTDSSESPNIMVDIAEEGKPDYSFEIQGVDMQGGGTITVLLDRKAGDLVINTEKLTNEGKFNLVLTRITEEDGEESYTAEDVALKAGALVYIEYGKWEGGGKGLYLGVDTNGDSEIDDEYEIEP